MRADRLHFRRVCVIAVLSTTLGVPRLRAQQAGPLQVQDSVTIARAAGASLASVSAVAVAGDGSLFVADNRAHMLRLYSHAGVELANAPLPHEQVSSAVLVTALAESNGVFYVYDATSMKLHRYRVSGRRIEENGVFSIGVRGVDLCAMGGLVYILGFKDGAILHAVDRSGRVVRSFGEGIGSSDPIRSSIITAGSRVRCLASSGLVVVIHHVSPVVRAFSSAGQVRWSYSVPGFRPISITSAGGTAVRFTMPSTSVDGLVSVFPLSDGLAGFQISRGPSGDGSEGRTLETVFVRADSGSVIAQTRSLPAITDAVAGYLVRLHSAPEGPKLVSWRYRMRGIGE